MFSICLYLVLELAVDEARRMGNGYIATEHLLLGLVRVDTGRGMEILKRLNVSPEEVRRQIRRALEEDRQLRSDLSTPPPAQPPMKARGNEPFTMQAEKVILLAREESKRMRDPYVGTEHLLIALMRQGDSKAARVLNSLMSLQVVDKAVSQLTASLPERESDAGVELSPDFKAVIELAIEEAARRTGRSTIGTDALLFALTRVTIGVGPEILKMLKVTPEAIRERFEHFVEAKPNVEGVSTALPSLLHHLTTDMLGEAKVGSLDPVIGRDAEIARLIAILGRLNNHNAVLIGDSGVGKTSIVEGLAQRISNRDVPPYLLDKRMLELDLGALVMNTKSRTQTGYDDLVRQLLVELSKFPSILFLGGFLKYANLSRERYHFHLDMLIRAASDEHKVTFIGEMLDEEYLDWQRSDPGLALRFQPIRVKQPSVEETLAMLRGSKNSYERHHQIEISDEALEAALNLSIQILPDLALPAKAFTVLDTAASQLHAKISSAPTEGEQANKTLPRLTAEHVAQAIAYGNDENLEQDSDKP